MGSQSGRSSGSRDGDDGRLSGGEGGDEGGSLPRGRPSLADSLTEPSKSALRSDAAAIEEGGVM